MIKANYTLECPTWPQSPYQCTTVMLLLRIVSVISFLGCLFVIFIIWLFREYRYLVQRLVLFLSISAAFKSLTYLVSDVYSNSVACRIQAFMMQYFDWSTLLWVATITVNIHLALHNKSSQRYEKCFHLVSWLLPFFWALLPFADANYGPAGVWCWIKRDSFAMRFGTWYIPAFLMILFLVLSYVYILRLVYKRIGSWSGLYNREVEIDNTSLVDEVKPLAAYPLIYLILTIPTFIYRIDDAVHPQKLPSYTLLILSVIASPAIGALNSVVFAFYGGIQNKLSFSQIKDALHARFSTQSGHVIHNYNVSDI